MATVVDYNAYIMSDAWKAKRQEILNRDGHRCTRCESKKRLQVHHLTYARLGQELDEDLATLCDPCHRDQHGMKQLREVRRKFGKTSPQAEAQKRRARDLEDFLQRVKSETRRPKIRREHARRIAQKAKAVIRPDAHPMKLPSNVRHFA